VIEPDEQQNDDRLMARVGAGEVGLLSMLFERHHRALFRFFNHLCSGGGVAEDLTQEVFFRMLKFRATFRPVVDGKEARFTPWMYQIARNVHADHLRKRRSETSLSEEGEMRREPSDPGISAELALVRSSDLTILRRAFQRLPADRRELLVLSRWQSLPYDEIAEILQCEPGAVKTRVFRAMRQLGDTFFRMSGRKVS
jgi:RNA polymerase sigma-70 factor (ECF subfamily)